MQRKDRPSEALNKPQVRENEYKHFYWLWPSDHIYRELVIMRCARRRLISDVCLLCGRFVFRTEASAKCEWLATKRKGPREGETRLISSLLPAFLHAQAFIERERERERRLGTRKGRWSVELHYGTGLCIRDIWPCSFMRNHTIAN